MTAARSATPATPTPAPSPDPNDAGPAQATSQAPAQAPSALATTRGRPEATGTPARRPLSPEGQKKALLAKRLERLPLQQVLPAHTTAERAIMLTLYHVSKSPALLACDVETIAQGVMQIAQWGLEIGRTAYLVPFNKKGGAKTCVAIADWKGKVELAQRGGSITSYRARVVYENDVFHVEYGLHEKLVHVPTWRGDPGKPVGAYAIVGLPSGEQKFDLMSVDAIERIRARSRAKDDGPWQTDWDEMGKKTVTHRLMKGVPQNPLMIAAQENEDVLEAEGAAVEQATRRPRNVRDPHEAYGGLANTFAAEAEARDVVDGDGVVIEDATEGREVARETIDMTTKPKPSGPLPSSEYGPDVDGPGDRAVDAELVARERRASSDPDDEPAVGDGFSEGIR